MSQASVRRIDGSKTLAPNAIGNSSRSPIHISTDALCLYLWEECSGEDRASTSWPGHVGIKMIGIFSHRSPATRRGITNRFWRSTAILKLGTGNRIRNIAEPGDPYLSSLRQTRIQ